MMMDMMELTLWGGSRRRTTGYEHGLDLDHTGIGTTNATTSTITQPHRERER